MFCRNCGTELREGAGFCHKCGTKAITETPVAEPVQEPVVEPVQEIVAEVTPTETTVEVVPEAAPAEEVQTAPSVEEVAEPSPAEPMAQLRKPERVTKAAPTTGATNKKKPVVHLKAVAAKPAEAEDKPVQPVTESAKLVAEPQPKEEPVQPVAEKDEPVKPVEEQPQVSQPPKAEPTTTKPSDPAAPVHTAKPNTCANCGEKLRAGTMVCPWCGTATYAPVGNTPTNQQSESAISQPSGSKAGAARFAATAERIKDMWNGESLHCGSCGARINYGVKFCPYCGHSTGVSNKETSHAQEGSTKLSDAVEKIKKTVTSAINQAADKATQDNTQAEKASGSAGAPTQSESDGTPLEKRLLIPNAVAKTIILIIIGGLVAVGEVLIKQMFGYGIFTVIIMIFKFILWGTAAVCFFCRKKVVYIAKCPNCGNQIGIPTDVEAVDCEKCQQRVIISDGVVRCATSNK